MTVTISSQDQPDEALRAIVGTANVEIFGATPTPPLEVSQQADLSTSTLELNPKDKIVTGSPIGITVIVKNTGSATAEDVIVTFPADSPIGSIELSPLEFTAVALSTDDGSHAYSVAAALNTDGNVSVRLQGVASDVTSGETTISAMITAASGVEQPIEAKIQVEPTPLPKLIVRADTPKNLTPGDAFDLVLYVTNMHEVAAENVKLDITTSPPVEFTIAGAPQAEIAQLDANSQILSLPKVALDNPVQIQLSGIAPTGSGRLLVNVDVQDRRLYDAASALSQMLRSKLNPQPTVAPVPTATPEPVDTQPPPTVEAGPSSTPIPVAEVTIPPAEPPDSSTTSLLVIGIVALLAAIVAGVVLFLLLRGRR
ncbi:MAG: hypothetical protein KDA51_02725, partial [Planctomycetales bacterium]|nr:hypothetical protein [Planctomycetales bacterium]